MYLVNQSTVSEPEHGQLVFLGSGTFLDKTIYKFLVFLGKLSGNTVPKHSDTRYSLVGRML